MQATKLYTQSQLFRYLIWGCLASSGLTLLVIVLVAWWSL